MSQFKSKHQYDHHNCFCKKNKCKNKCECYKEFFNRYQKCRDTSDHGANIPDDEMKIVVDMANQPADKYDGITLSNGRLGVKSTRTPHKFEFPYLAGVFEDYGRLANRENTAQMLNPCTLVIRSDLFAYPYGLTSAFGTMPPDEGTYYQTLDMKRAVLTSEYDAGGGKLHVKHDFRALRNAQFVCMSVVEITNKTAEKQIIEPYMIVTKPKHLFKFTYQHNIIDELDGTFFPDLKMSTKMCVQNLYCTAEGPSGKKYASTTMFVSKEQLHTVYIPGSVYVSNIGPKMLGTNVQWNDNNPASTDDDNLIGEIYYIRTLEPGETDRFVIYHIMATSDDFPDLTQHSQVTCRYLSAEFPAEIIRRHEEAWAQLWNGDIVVQGGGPNVSKDQLDIRIFLYNLYSNIRDDTELSPGPTALTNNGYNGHIFWDSEIWMLPPLLLLNQNIARSMLEFRWNQFAEYKKNASMFGYRGISVAWEAARDGFDHTPWYAAVSSQNQIHVTGDVAFAFYLFYLVTGDENFLKERAWPIVVAAADFFVTRSVKGDDGKYHINVVIGPNENNNCFTYVNDNGYTNALATTILNVAQEFAKKLCYEPDPIWKVVADGLVVHKFDGVECNGVPAGVIKNHVDFCNEVCGVKQVDTDLISYPITTYPTYQLDNPADATTLKNSADFYSSLILSSGPAMASAIFSIIYNAVGDATKAEQNYRDAFNTRLLPPFNNLEEASGNRLTYFLTGAGGILQAVLFGFGGLRIDREKAGNVYQVPSSLPVGWESLTVYGVGKDCQTFTAPI